VNSKRFLRLAWVAGLTAAAQAGSWLPASAADAYLPGITIDDPSPQGCVSCHQGEMSLKRQLAALKHRNIDGQVEVVPDDCKTCHDEDEGLDSMSAIAHSMHYASLSSSEFVTRYQGSCLHCHAMATGSGEVTVKSGKKNW
jgi:hypothetical protein